MHVSGSGLNHAFDQPHDPESLKRRLAIRILMTISAAGMVFVAASWLAGRLP